MKATLRRTAVIAALAYLSNAANAEVSNPDSAVAVRNAGFEEETEGVVPPGWKFLGDPRHSSIVLDRSIAHNGSHSAKLTADGSLLTSFAQPLNAVPLIRKTVVLTAFIKTHDAGDLQAAVWLRVDSLTTSAIAFDNMANSWTRGDNDWVKVRASVWVPDGAAAVIVGGLASGKGEVWFDDVQLRIEDTNDDAPASAVALGYLRVAFNDIRRLALPRNDRDWDALWEWASAHVRGAENPADTYPTLRLLLQRLDDRHSFLMTPAQSDRLQASREDVAAVVEGHPLDDSIAYLRIPAFSAISEAAGHAFAARVRAALRRAGSQASCGYVVDLRGNGGGNMWPMLGGLAPFFHDGDLGFFRSNSSSVPWGKRGDAIYSGQQARYFVTPRDDLTGLADKPVAVLIGRGTASSGEAVAISFKGRAKTRFFGQPTAGLTTSNELIRLSDGASLWVTSSVDADRRGTIYYEPVMPDEAFEQETTSPSAARGDATLDAAASWLHRACK